MKNMITKLTARLVIAGLLAMPLAFGTSTALAGGCPKETPPTEKVMAAIEAAQSTVESASVDAAYEKIESVSEYADELNVDTIKKIRDGIGGLVKTLQKRTNEQFDATMQSYEDGYHSEALAEFEKLTALKGLPAAKKAQTQLDKEDDRSAWRTAQEQATKLINDKSYLEAREPLNDMKRLARRADYSKQTTSAFKEFGTAMMTDVGVGKKMIAQEQYDQAYSTLIAISRLSHARESALAARKILAKNATLDGMRQAKGEYEANAMLDEAQAWYSEIANPSPNETQAFQQKLEAITKSYKGTAAADKAESLLTSDDAQAAR